MPARHDMLFAWSATCLERSFIASAPVLTSHKTHLRTLVALTLLLQHPTRVSTGADPTNEPEGTIAPEGRLAGWLIGSGIAPDDWLIPV